jgi:tetratricopeptide (TPR) repeat protein
VPSGRSSPPKATLAEIFAELKRRRVFRALAGWAVIAFAVLQVVEPLSHGLDLPSWALKATIWLLAAGFPVALVLAWLFDLTAQGVKRTPSATGTAAGWGGARPALALLVVGALIGAGVAWLAPRHAGPIPPVGTDGRVVVAVADFANQTGEPALDALSGLLITSLEQSRKLRVLTRGRMLEVLRQGGHEKVERIDESLARQVGGKGGVRALLLASIQKLGQSYVVELRAIDPQRDHYIFTLREQSSDQAGILPLIDRLSEQTRLRLRESDAEVQASDIKVAEAVTPNLEAYRHYFAAEHQVALWHVNEAAASYRKALELDPTLAAATLRLAYLDLALGFADLDPASDLVTRARPLPEKDRSLALFLDALNRNALADVCDRGQKLAIRFPDDKVLVWAAFLGLAACGDLEGALRAARGSLALDPSSGLAASGVIGLLIMDGRTDEARRVVAALGDGPTELALSNAAWLAIQAGDLDGAERDLRASFDSSPTLNFLDWITGISILTARADPDALDRSEAEIARRAPDPWMTVWHRVSVWLARGRIREALALYDEQRRSAREPRKVQWDRIRILATAGRLHEAREAAARVAPSPQTGWFLFPALHRMGATQTIEAIHGQLHPTGYPRRLGGALLAAHRGDTTGALAELRSLDNGGRSEVAYFRGTLAARSGLDAEAVEALARFERLGTPGISELDRVGMLAEGRLAWAGALDRLGRRPEARAVVERQLRLWKGADPDLPLLAEAKAMQGRLAAPASAGGRP